MTSSLEWVAQISPRAFKQPNQVLLLFILGMAAALYWYEIGAESLWVDELLSIQRAKDWDYLFRDPRPVYYLLLTGWMRLGEHDAWLRGLSTLFGIGSVFLTYRLARQLLNERTGLLSALLLALSPLLINHAQEVRMYAVSTCVGVGGTLAMAYALASPTRTAMRWWTGLRFLAIVTTPLNALLLLPDIVLFGWHFRKQRSALISGVKGLFMISVLWLPVLIPLITKTVPEFMRGIRPLVPSEESIELFGQSRPNGLNILLQAGRYTAWPFGAPNSPAIAWFYRVYATFLTGILGVALLTKPRLSRIYWLATWTFLPLLALFGVSQVSRSLWLDRYLLFAAPYMLILLAVGFLRLWQHWRMGAIAMSVIYFIAVGGGLKRYYTVLDRENWRGIVETLNVNDQPGDVVVWSIGQRIPVALNHYYRGNASIEVRDLPQAEQIEEWVQSLPTPQSRLWLVYSSPAPALRSLLESQFEIQAHRRIHPVEIFLLEPRPVSPTQ